MHYRTSLDAIIEFRSFLSESSGAALGATAVTLSGPSLPSQQTSRPFASARARHLYGDRLYPKRRVSEGVKGIAASQGVTLVGVNGDQTDSILLHHKFDFTNMGGGSLRSKHF